MGIYKPSYWCGNIQCEGPHIAICMNDNLYGVQDIRVSTSVDLSKGIVVCPLLSFYFFLFFQFFCIFLVASMALSISLICPLWDLLILSSLGSFPHLRGNTLYISRSIEDLSHV